MAKLNKGMQALVIQANDEQIPHLVSVIRRKQSKDLSLPHWYYNKPIAYYEGLLQGAYATIEQILMAHNQYKGYGVYQGDELHRVYCVPRG